MIPTEWVKNRMVQPIEGIDCDQCVFVNDSDDTCYKWRCTEWRRDDKKHVYYVEVD